LSQLTHSVAVISGDSLLNKLRNPKYLNGSQLKLLNFQTPLSHTAGTDINSTLLVDN